MIPDTLGPLSRPLALHTVTPAGTEVRVEATEDERAALARDLDLPAIHSLVARLRVVGHPDRISVTGRVKARLDQVCVVTLEPFETELDEEVEVEFQTPERRRPGGRVLDLDPDAVPVDEIASDRIDLGTITSEFLALGLDPYPRKPGVAFENPAEPAGDSPFARLASLRPDEPKP